MLLGVLIFSMLIGAYNSKLSQRSLHVCGGILCVFFWHNDSGLVAGGDQTATLARGCEDSRIAVLTHRSRPPLLAAGRSRSTALLVCLPAPHPQTGRAHPQQYRSSARPAPAPADWPSYNVPYYAEVYTRSGYPDSFDSLYADPEAFPTRALILTTSTWFPFPSPCRPTHAMCHASACSTSTSRHNGFDVGVDPSFFARSHQRRHHGVVSRGPHEHEAARRFVLIGVLSDCCVPIGVHFRHPRRARRTMAAAPSTPTSTSFLFLLLFHHFGPFWTKFKCTPTY